MHRSVPNMKTFSLALANGGQVTGHHNLPDGPSKALLKYKPLVVGLHGGSYSSEYFDVDEKHTAAIQSNALGVPFVAIDRPCYKGTTPIAPLTDFFQKSASVLNEYILPAVWNAFGKPQGCSAIVLLCHSLGAPPAAITAVQHGKFGSNQAFPLAGMIVSGFGTVLATEDFIHYDPDNPPKTYNMPLDVKDQMMMPPGTCAPDAYEHTARLDQPCPFEEVLAVRVEWLKHFKADWAEHIKIPVMIGLAEKDTLWRGTKEAARDFADAFTSSERVEAGVILGAPHNIELSFWSQGWYARCFGFAVECATDWGVADK